MSSTWLAAGTKSLASCLDAAEIEQEFLVLRFTVVGFRVEGLGFGRENTKKQKQIVVVACYGTVMATVLR